MIIKPTTTGVENIQDHSVVSRDKLNKYVAKRTCITIIKKYINVTDPSLFDLFSQKELEVDIDHS